MDGWLERLGYAVQLAGDTLANATRGAVDGAAELAEDADLDDVLDAEDAAPLGGVAGMAVTAVGGWLAARLLGEREVSLGRAVLAGVIGTVLYDAVMAVDQRVFGRNFETIRALGATVTDDESLQQWVGWAAHYAAGVGLAMLYARHVYGRLPGPPVAQGAAFGLLDAATLGWGGVYPLLNRFAPGIRVPPGFTGLAAHPGDTAQTLLRHLAYGVGVGLVYRPDDRGPMPRWRRELLD